MTPLPARATTNAFTGPGRVENLFRLGLAALLLVAIGQTLALAWAEWQARLGTQASLHRAVASGRTAHWRALAGLAATGFTDDREDAVLVSALQENPRDSATWIALGLAYERQGLFPAADLALAEAEKMDRQYFPAWTHANFAFRHRNNEQFWKSAHMALATAPSDDPRPLFELADRTPLEIPSKGLDQGLDNRLARLDRLLGDCLSSYQLACEQNTRRLERAYLDYLISKARWRNAIVLGLRMEGRTTHTTHGGTVHISSSAHSKGEAGEASLAIARTDDIARMRDLAARLAESGELEGAIEIWNQADQRSTVDEVVPDRITNAKFLYAPSAAGFNWQAPRPSGVRVTWRPQELEFQMSGEQPDECILLEQPIVLSHSANRTAYLRWRYSLYPAAGSAQRLQFNGGLAWSLVDQEGRIWRAPEARKEARYSREPVAALADHDGWVDAQAGLAPAQVGLPAKKAAPAYPFAPDLVPHSSPTLSMVRLRLTLSRGLGTDRAKGVLILREVQLAADARPANPLPTTVAGSDRWQTGLIRGGLAVPSRSSQPPLEEGRMYGTNRK